MLPLFTTIKLGSFAYMECFIDKNYIYKLLRDSVYSNRSLLSKEIVLINIRENIREHCSRIILSRKL